MTRSAYDIMRPLQSQPALFSSDTTKSLGIGLIVAFVVILATFLIAGGIRSGGGPGQSDHPTPIPAQVVPLNASTYLVDRGATVSADNICWGDNGDNRDPIQVATDQYEPRLQATFVQCGADQRWSVHKAPGWSYSTALARTGSDLVFDLGAGGFFLLCLSPAALSALGDAVRYRKARTAYIATAEDVRRELRIAFAHDEIEETEMEHGLNVLYNIKGVKRPAEEPHGDPFKK